MERARVLAQVWDWLPAFRAVAETQHLPTAAQAMRVSPSALSRAVRLLEDAIGHELFDRVGRNIALNERGVRLLESVRDAMRGVHSAIEFIDGGLLVGPVRVSAPAQWQPAVIPDAVDTLAVSHPGLVIDVVTIPAGRIAAALRQGSIDVALTDVETSSEQLTRELVRECSISLYAPKHHPLTKRRKLQWKDVTTAAHISIAHYGEGVWQLQDSEPHAHVSDPLAGALLCQRQCAVTVLPDILAEALGLVRLPLATGATIPLVVLHRPTLTIPGRTEAIADVLRATLAQR